MQNHPNLGFISQINNRTIIENSTYSYKRQSGNSGILSDKKNNKCSLHEKGDVALIIIKSNIKSELKFMNFSISGIDVGETVIV